MERSRTAYHHGNLRRALLDAALGLTRAGGPSGLVLREVTARVGVSPNAAYRHFADRDTLLAAVRVEVQQLMAARMAAPDPATRRDPEGAVAELQAVGLGYIEFALAEPGWFEVAFATPQLVDARPPGGVPDGRGGPEEPDADGGEPLALPAPLRRLVEALDDLVAAGVLPAERRAGAEWPCWSAVHGFALLALQGPLRAVPPGQQRAAAERTVHAVVRGLLDV